MPDPEKVKQFEKLMAHPVEVEFSVKGEVFKAWMHALVDSQTLHCSSVFMEQKEIILKDGQDPKYAELMGVVACDCQMLVYSLKKGKERGSEQVFKRVGEVLLIQPEERIKLTKKYEATFALTEEDLGNLLRARTDISTLKSPSPATSPAN